MNNQRIIDKSTAGLVAMGFDVAIAEIRPDMIAIPIKKNGMDGNFVIGSGEIKRFANDEDTMNDLIEMRANNARICWRNFNGLPFDTNRAPEELSKAVRST